MTRIMKLLFWLCLSLVAALGLLSFGLFLLGAIQFVWLDCGPRSNWSEASYSACSDIDETNPIFLSIALACMLPMIAVLLLRRLWDWMHTT
ncbi:hypothetical protein [Gymnodinialimonas hymeniacidonis]|uniref:hypothetical protein n=1 Tax=Gymnodinialimonas hymeniacidonis TaxID=3126508 RepID=UPI0034C6D101